VTTALRGGGFCSGSASTAREKIEDDDDTEEDVKLGQITFNVKDLYQLENFEEPFGSFNIGNQKVIMEVKLG
jgi:hypothetical protein